MSAPNSDAVLMVEGQAVPLRLSLRALAEVEDALGASTLFDLAAKLGNPSAHQLLSIVTILALAAAPNDEREAVSQKLSNASINLADILSVLSRLFTNLLTQEAPGKPTRAGTDGAVGSPFGPRA